MHLVVVKLGQSIYANAALYHTEHVKEFDISKKKTVRYIYTSKYSESMSFSVVYLNNKLKSSSKTFSISKRHTKFKGEDVNQ